MVSWKVWPEWCCRRMNCRICANHPDSGWLAAKSTWIALELISWRHNRKRAVEVPLETKNATCMQNNPKTELHVRSDPQMRIHVQTFCSIVAINVFSTVISSRSYREFWPTNEKPFATFLLARNNLHFFDHDILEKRWQVFFTFECYGGEYLTFGWSSKRGTLLMKKKEKIWIYNWL